MKPTYQHHNNGTTVCVLRDKSNNVVYGYAYLHPEEQVESRRIGEYIATIRAEIKYYKLILRNELEPKRKALLHLKTCITDNNNKKYNLDSAEAKLIKRQCCIAESDCETVKQTIKELQHSLDWYLQARDNLVNGQNKVIE